MTINQREACLTEESMERLAQGEFPAAELAQLEEHIGTCERCRHMLESASFDSLWNDEVLPVLRTPSDANGVFGDQKDGGHDEQSLESLLKLLGPTDDPHRLGRIGTYEVIGVIGRGGMGVVFKAFDAALNRFVAIKMLLPHLAISGAARKRFAREGQAAAAVIDDNVLPIYSVAEWQGVPYLVTQYSRGMTLQKRIQDQGPLELKEILRIGMQTARGLAAAHTQGLVHRDVKPSNILLDGTVERALLTDFGLARAVDDASITRTGVIAGTPQYMSPEQARGGSVDARSDLFGLGCVLYTMCTGRPPFRAENSYAVLRLITDAEPRPIQEVNPEIPEWLCRLISRLMAKSPHDRFRSATEVANLLESCLAHVQQPTVTSLPEEFGLAQSAANGRRYTGRWMAAIGAMLIGLLGLFGFVISIQSQDGTLLIESTVDDVTVRVSQGDAVVRRLTVTKAGTKIDVAAGSYTVAVEGNVDGIAIENDKVNLQRGGTEIVKLTYQRPAETTRSSVGSTVAQQTTQKLLQQIIEKTVLYVTDVKAAGQVLYFKLHRRGEEPPVNARLKIVSHYEKPVPFEWSGPIGADIDVMPGDASEIALPLIPAEGTKVALLFHDSEMTLSAAKQLSSIGDRSLLLEQLRANLATGVQKGDGIIHGEHSVGGKYSIEFSMVFDSTTSTSLNISGIQDSPSVPVDQHVKMLEKAIYATDVRSEGQVLYFTLKQRKLPEGVFGLLEIQFHCEKPMPLVWTGPAPDVATVVSPTHTVTWVGTGYPMIPLPLAPEGHKVAFIFPDNESAVVAAKQLTAIGDQSLLDAQRRANSIDGRLRDDGIIFGEHAAIGKFTSHFRVHVRKNVTPDQPGHGIQRPQFIGVNWRPLYLAVVTHHHTAERHSLTESQEREVRKLFDEFVRTATVETHDDVQKLTQAKIEAVLTREQNEKVRREIWLGWNVSKFRDPKIMFQLQFSDTQQQQVDAVWKALELQTGPIQDPSSSPNIPEFFRPHRFAVEGPTQWQRVFDEIFAILTIQQRAIFLREIQDPIVDGVLTDPRQRALAVPRGAVREVAVPANSQMTLAFHTINWRPLYIGRAMEPQLAKWHQITPDQRERMLEISQKFLRDATPTTREAEEKLAQSAVQDLLTVEQDQLLRKEIWLAINATRLRAPAAQDQLGLEPHQRRQIDEVWSKFEAEVTRNGGWLADGTDSHRQVFEDIMAVLTEAQRELYFSKLQDSVFDSGHLPGASVPDSERVSSLLLDVLKQDMERELSRFPLLDLVREDLRLLEGGGLEILEQPVKEDREQYTKDHPDLAKAFEAWQSDYRDVIRVTEVIPELFDKDNNAHEMMVTIARLLIESEDIPEVSKERLAEAHRQLGDRPSDETVEKLFLELATDQLFNLQRKLRESGANVPHTGMHEDHLRIAEEAETQLEFARLYCAIEQSEMFRQIRKLQESADPATTFLFEESHPGGKDETLVFISSRGREEVRVGERGYHALPEPSATVTWKIGEQEGRLKNADAVLVTHAIIDQRQDDAVVWRCYGIPKAASVHDALGSVLPSEGIVDLNVLTNNTEEARVRFANRQLRDPNAALLAELQGTWLMTAIVSPDGKIEPVSDPVGTGHSVHFKDSTLTLHQGQDEEPVPMKFTLDASMSTPEVDIAMLSGLFTLGLIETRDGTLHLQLGDAGGKRPGESIKPAVHYQYRRIPASLVALGDQKTEGALNQEDVQRQEEVIREANRLLKDPNRVLLAQLQGTWTVTSMVLPDGKTATLPNPAEAGMVIRFDDKSGYISQGTDDEGSQFTYIVDATTSPATIDLQYANGTHVLGLIEIKNGTLELQLGAGGDARPSPAMKPSIHQLYRRTGVYWQWIPARE